MRRCSSWVVGARPSHVVGKIYGADEPRSLNATDPKTVEDDLHTIGVRTVVIHAKADPAAPATPPNTDPRSAGP